MVMTCINARRVTVTTGPFASEVTRVASLGALAFSCAQDRVSRDHRLDSGLETDLRSRTPLCEVWASD